MKRLAVLAVATLLLVSCKEKVSADRQDGLVEAPPAADVRAKVSAPASRTDQFLQQLDSLRARIRDESLELTTEVPGDIPLYRINVDMDTEFMMYTGQMDLWVKNRSNQVWKELHFHLYPNFGAISGDLKNVRVKTAEVNSESAEFSERGPRLVITLPSPLQPGQAVHSYVVFEGLIKRGATGSGDSVEDMWGDLGKLLGGSVEDYGVFAYSSGIVSMALWYPVLAAYDDAWDWPQDTHVGDFSYFVVSDHAVSVEIDSAFTLITTGVEARKQQEGNRTFYAGAAREFMLMASKKLLLLTKMAGRSNKIAVNSYAFASDTGTQKMVLESAVNSVNVFEKLFGPYPYRELDVVEADLGAGIGGVEFPGLVTIARMLYLDTTKGTVPEAAAVVDSRFIKESIEFVVAHEVAHQWWNAVVGSHSRLHPFVDEALANYSAILYFEEIHGKGAMNRQILFELKLPYQLHRFLGGIDRPVDMPTSEYTDMIEYSAIVYGKGALFLHELRRYMATEPFLKALSNYYSKYTFRIASPSQLLAEFTALDDDPEKIEALAERWLEEKHGDEDIQLLDPGIIVPAVLDELGLELDSWVVDLMKEEGFWELVKLAANIAEGEEDMFDGVRLDKIVDWGSKIGKKLLFDMISF